MRHTIPEPVQPYHKMIVEKEPFLSVRNGLSGRHSVAIRINARQSDNALDDKLLNRLRDLVFKYASNQVFYSVLWRPHNNHLCTGMDLYSLYAQLHQSTKTKPLRDYFKTAYQTAYYVATLEKPFLPVLNGDVAGLGAGIALSAVFPIATETSRVSFPGCRYGSLGAEGGALFKMARLPGRIGEYLLLSGKTLHSSDLCHLGLAQHYMISDRADLLEMKLSEVDKGDLPTLLNTMSAFMDKPDESTILNYFESINRCFEKETVAEIMQALREETVHTEWAKNTLAFMEKNSPLAMALTLRATRAARYLPLLGCLNLEYAIMSRLIQHPEFAEGVAAIVENRAPHWTYSAPAEVPLAVVDSFVANLPIRKTLRLEPITEGTTRIDAAAEVARYHACLGFISNIDDGTSDKYGGPFAELSSVVNWARTELLGPAGAHTYHSLLNREDEVIDSIEELADEQFPEVTHSHEG